MFTFRTEVAAVLALIRHDLDASQFQSLSVDDRGPAAFVLGYARMLETAVKREEEREKSLRAAMDAATKQREGETVSTAAPPR